MYSSRTKEPGSQCFMRPMCWSEIMGPGCLWGSGEKKRRQRKCERRGLPYCRRGADKVDPVLSPGRQAPRSRKRHVARRLGVFSKGIWIRNPISLERNRDRHPTPEQNLPMPRPLDPCLI